MPLRLEKASARELPGLRDMLLELGHGESGFSGTSFGRGEQTLQFFLQSCIDGEDPAKIKPDLVPQTSFWIIDDHDIVVGIIRMRHYLNDRLLQSGGHIGYYIRRNERQKGYAKAALRLALAELRTRGVTRALVTVDARNAPSWRVAHANGGKLDPAQDTSQGVQKFWIELAIPQ